MSILAQDESVAEVIEVTLDGYDASSVDSATTFTATGIILFFVIVACVLFMKFIHRQKSVATLAKEMKEKK